LSNWEGKFETLIRIAANGSVENAQFNNTGPVVACIYKKVHSSQQDKSPLFPAPPMGSYWVRIDFDWAEFAPVAAQR
jgi:hypothetical protein